jgi:hypothetical protein
MMQVMYNPDISVPSDFPSDYFLGAVSGAQEKLLVREVNGKFLAGPTPFELWTRWDNAEDLAEQLADKTLKKLHDGRISDLDVYYAGIERLVQSKNWDLSKGEITWLMKRTRVMVDERMQDLKD